MKSQTSLQEKIGSLIRLCLIVSLLIIGIRPISAQNNIVLRSETDGSVYRWEVEGFSDYGFGLCVSREYPGVESCGNPRSPQGRATRHPLAKSGRRSGLLLGH